MDVLVPANELRWQQVPGAAIRLYEKLAAPVKKIRQAIRDLPQDGFLDLWLDPDENKLILNAGDWMDGIDQWRTALEPYCDSFEWEDEAGDLTRDNPNWVKIAFVWEPPPLSHAKEAYSPLLRGLGQAGGFFPSKLSDKIPGVPSPMAAMIASGLLGAGTGYGAGWLAEKMLPSEWKRKRLRHTLAVLGGLGGVVPGATWAGANVAAGRRWNDPLLFDHYPLPNVPQPRFKVTRAALAAAPGEIPPYIKQAQGRGRTGLTEASLLSGRNPPIDVFSLAGSLNDPSVASRMSPSLRAATGGILGGASHLRGGARVVWPTDIARIGVGMGSGYLSGLLAGKVMGVLTGMPSKAQNRLRQTGMWAGVLANVVPLMFR